VPGLLGCALRDSSVDARLTPFRWCRPTRTTTRQG